MKLMKLLTEARKTMPELQDLLLKHPQPIKILYEWVRTGVVSLKEFQELLKFVTSNSLTEAEVDTPGQVMKKAQLAKTRADMQQLTQKQRTLGQSRKNVKDTPTRRRLSKQIADLGAKKADLGVRTAEMSKQIKKPAMEGRLVEETSLDPEIEDALLIIAKNERKFYDKKDAKGAIEYAIKSYLRDSMEQLAYDLNHAKNDLVRELANYWKREGR